MGCLNADVNFDHWFGNIHLSGPCNRSCYFCIGQWMPGQDMQNNLSGKIKGFDEFVAACKDKGITEINITGTNTDPLMRDGIVDLIADLRAHGFSEIGLRTNGVLTDKFIQVMPFLTKASVSVTSFIPELYKKQMGSGSPPDIYKIAEEARHHDMRLKLNTVLCPERLEENLDDLITTAIQSGVQKVNLREPYGQSHIGNPLLKFNHMKMTYGNPTYFFGGVEVTYWDVHWTCVCSVNLYADGHISHDYSVSKGHSDELGDVKDQSNFSTGRQAAQWKGTKIEKTVG